MTDATLDAQSILDLEDEYGAEPSRHVLDVAQMANLINHEVCELAILARVFDDLARRLVADGYDKEELFSRYITD